MRETNPRLQSEELPAGAPAPAGAGGDGREAVAEDQALREAVQYVLSDCFFAVGQTIGMRMTVDYDAVVWWHDHFHAKFLAAMRRDGNRWLQDRESVTAVGWMLAERAVRHAAGRDAVDVEAARRAAADVERYCRIRSKRGARAGDLDAGAIPRLAGYWCVEFPY